MVHQLKIEREFFDAVTKGDKNFEVRINDRDFQVGDILGLNEVDADAIETGRCTLAEITYILSKNDLLCKKTVVLGIIPFPLSNMFKISTCAMLMKGKSQQIDTSGYAIHDRAEVDNNEPIN